MTCAHVVHVALKKVAGVDAVEVSLNKGLATVKLKPGNTVTVSQLWELIHRNGYTPKSTAVTARGELGRSEGELQLTVSGSKETVGLAVEPKNPVALAEASKKAGQTVVVQGVMTPGKDLKSRVPLQVSQVK